MVAGSKPVAVRCYPELDFGGFTRHDGVIAFYGRLQALLQREWHVLDIGCGRGEHAADPCIYRRKISTVRGKCSKVIGIDVELAGRENPLLDEYRLITDINRWPVEDGEIDLAFADYVLEHVTDPNAFFRECRRVLKPGGYLLLRTPNKFSYIALAARIIPNRYHGRVVTKVHATRHAHDVFPTVYRCNTRGALRESLRHHGFVGTVYRHEGEPSYLSFSDFAYHIGTIVHRFMPDVLKSTLFAFARREPG